MSCSTFARIAQSAVDWLPASAAISDAFRLAKLIASVALNMNANSMTPIKSTKSGKTRANSTSVWPSSAASPIRSVHLDGATWA